MSDPNRQLAGFAMEHPAAMAAIDELGVRHGASLELVLVTPDLLRGIRGAGGDAALNDVLARTPDLRSMYVVKPDGQTIDLSEER